MSFYGAIYKLLAAPLRGMFRVRASHPERLPEDRGCLLCANHTSMADVVVISTALRRQVRYMAKKELFRVPLIGPLLKALGAYPVDRGGADATSIRKTLRFIEEGQLVGMFPQGTRRPKVDPATTPIKAGAGMIAYHAKCDVIPVFIRAKNNQVRFFRKSELLVGEPIHYEELGFSEGGMKEYTAATQVIFDRICALGKDAGEGDA